MKLKDTYPQHAGKKVRFLQSHSRVIKVPSSETHPFKYDDTGEDVFMTPYILNNDVWVVEPKSPIEEAIEREAYDSCNNPVSTTIEERMRRIVNLTLDEAKKAVSDPIGGRISTNEAWLRIDALKVNL